MAFRIDQRRHVKARIEQAAVLALDANLEPARHGPAAQFVIEARRIVFDQFPADVDDDTVVARAPGSVITYEYDFDGEQLTLDMVDDQCGPCGGDVV